MACFFTERVMGLGLDMRHEAHALVTPRPTRGVSEPFHARTSFTQVLAQQLSERKVLSI